MSEGRGHDFSSKISGTLNEGGSISKQLNSKPDLHTELSGNSLFKKLSMQAGEDTISSTSQDYSAARVAEHPEVIENQLDLVSGPNLDESSYGINDLNIHIRNDHGSVFGNLIDVDGNQVLHLDFIGVDNKGAGTGGSLVSAFVIEGKRKGADKLTAEAISVEGLSPVGHLDSGVQYSFEGKNIDYSEAKRILEQNPSGGVAIGIEVDLKNDEVQNKLGRMEKITERALSRGSIEIESTPILKESASEQIQDRLSFFGGRSDVQTITQTYTEQPLVTQKSSDVIPWDDLPPGYKRAYSSSNPGLSSEQLAEKYKQEMSSEQPSLKSGTDRAEKLESPQSRSSESSNPQNDAMRIQAEESANAAAEEKRKLEEEAAAKSARRQAEIDRITKLQSEFAAIAAAKEAELVATKEAEAKAFRAKEDELAGVTKEEREKIELQKKADEASTADYIIKSEAKGFVGPGGHVADMPYQPLYDYVAPEPVPSEPNPNNNYVDKPTRTGPVAPAVPEPGFFARWSREGKKVIDYAAAPENAHNFPNEGSTSRYTAPQSQESQEPTPTPSRRSGRGIGQFIGGVGKALGGVVDAIRAGTDATPGTAQFLEEERSKKEMEVAETLSSNYGDILGLDPQQIADRIRSDRGIGGITNEIKQRQKQIAEAEAKRPIPAVVTEQTRSNEDTGNGVPLETSTSTPERQAQPIATPTPPEIQPNATPTTSETKKESVIPEVATGSTESTDIENPVSEQIEDDIVIPAPQSNSVSQETPSSSNEYTGTGWKDDEDIRVEKLAEERRQQAAAERQRIIDSQEILDADGNIIVMTPNNSRSKGVPQLSAPAPKSENRGRPELTDNGQNPFIQQINNSRQGVPVDSRRWDERKTDKPSEWEFDGNRYVNVKSRDNN